jgi:hypothetical protein
MVKKWLRKKFVFNYLIRSIKLRQFLIFMHFMAYSIKINQPITANKRQLSPRAYLPNVIGNFTNKSFKENLSFRT